MTAMQKTAGLNLNQCVRYLTAGRGSACMKLCCLCLWAVLLSACSNGSRPPVASKQAATAIALPVEKGWWYARFRFAWPDQEPQWYLGTMLAAEVIRPVLTEHRSHIDLWRFHRRAAHDGGEHMFSFIVYSTPATAEKIYQSIDQNTVLNQLKEEEKVVWVGFNDVQKVAYPNIQDTSDKNWPDLVQKTWPAYIMGASQMWLDLAYGMAENEDQVLTKDALYRRVQTKLTALWMGQGKHVLLHHLNALYAYQPMLMRF